MDFYRIYLGRRLRLKRRAISQPTRTAPPAAAASCKRSPSRTIRAAPVKALRISPVLAPRALATTASTSEPPARDFVSKETTTGKSSIQTGAEAAMLKGFEAAPARG